MQSIEEIARRLARYEPDCTLGEEVQRQAAVAMIVRASPVDAQSELLFIRRAQHPSDPWSGHMAFPGGRVDPEDTSPEAAAIRETEEEVGLRLYDQGRRLGRLSTLMAKAHGKPLPMAVHPFVFALSPEAQTRHNHEVAETLWIPLSYFAGTANREEFDYLFSGSSFSLPCYHYEGRRIWGLSLSMLDELRELLG